MVWHGLAFGVPVGAFLPFYVFYFLRPLSVVLFPSFCCVPSYLIRPLSFAPFRSSSFIRLISFVPSPSSFLLRPFSFVLSLLSLSSGLSPSSAFLRPLPTDVYMSVVSHHALTNDAGKQYLLSPIEKKWVIPLAAIVAVYCNRYSPAICIVLSVISFFFVVF